MPGASELGARIPLVWPLTSRTAYVANGNLGDQFFLRDRLRAAGPKRTGDIARSIRRVLHDHAVRSDVRPLALTIILGSIEGRRGSILHFDVTGSQIEFDAWAQGHGSLAARDALRAGWRPDLGRNQALDLLDRAFRGRPYTGLELRANGGPVAVAN